MHRTWVREACARPVLRACSVTPQSCPSRLCSGGTGGWSPATRSLPEAWASARGLAALRPAPGWNGALGPSSRRPFSGRRCGRTRRSGSSMDPAGSARRRSPVSASGPRVSGREPGARGQRSGRAAAADAEPAEQPASDRRWSVPPHQAQLRRGGGGRKRGGDCRAPGAQEPLRITAPPLPCKREPEQRPDPTG